VDTTTIVEKHKHVNSIIVYISNIYNNASIGPRLVQTRIDCGTRLSHGLAACQDDVEEGDSKSAKLSLVL
jgi:hypothetical protein